MSANQTDSYVLQDGEPISKAVLDYFIECILLDGRLNEWIARALVARWKSTGQCSWVGLINSELSSITGCRGNQNCVLFFFAPSNTTVKRVNWYPGALDDVK